MQLSNVIYTGIFLDDASKDILSKAFPRRFSNIFCDHVTLAFRPNLKDIRHIKFGTEASFEVIGYAGDDQGEAAAVSGIQIADGSIPHVTISTADDVPPAYSQELLKRGFKDIAPFKLTGKIGYWDGEKAVFEAIHALEINTVIIPSRPQPDTIAAIFALMELGPKKLILSEHVSIKTIPSFESGKDFDSLVQQGILTLDAGGGVLDHHDKMPATTCTELMLSFLGAERDSAFAKLVEYVRRDDMTGKGTISTDPIDKAFGFSGLVTALNKTHPTDTEYVVMSALPLIRAHYEEEVRRVRELPQEFKQLTAAGKIEILAVKQRDKKLKVVCVESDNTSLPGFLRSRMGGGFDVVVQRNASGHVNIMTRPIKRIDLRSLALLIRLEESNHLGLSLEHKDQRYLSQAGKVPEIANWYYDTATNSILNGGVNFQDVLPTKIEWFTLKKLIDVGLSERLWSPMAR